MNDAWLTRLKNDWLPKVESGMVGPAALAERILSELVSSDAAFQADVDRRRRCGLGEVIYGPGKSAEMIVSIAQRLLAVESEVLVTRVEATVARAVGNALPYSRYDLLGRTLRLRLSPFSCELSPPTAHAAAQVGVVCAGSTDLPVAREAIETLNWMNVPNFSIVDVGVAGPYRLLPHLDRLRQAVALVVIAGMEGALASVVGGLVPCPVVAVPTSVGYGANLHGVTTLLSMLSSCAAGVTTVNIDAGFKGGYVAGLIARQSIR